MQETTIVKYLQEMIEEVTYLTVEPDQPLVLDSLTAAQVKWRVDLDLDVDVPLEDYLQGLSLEELAELIEAGATAAKNELEFHP